MSKSTQIAFPRLRKIELTGFTLYQRNPTVILNVPEGVLCFAGANGIGKSTLLAATNFGLTGSVPEPNRSLTSKRGYFEDASTYASKFFDGRIGRDDHEVAEVNLDFDLAGLRWSLRRGVFDGRGLRALSINDAESGKAVYNGDKYSSEERKQQYESRLAAGMGLEAFEQFVFLQHFVLTFDEGRDLLFWNQAALERMLRIAFGESLTEAHLADNLRREAAKAGSLGRNYQWQATTFLTQLRQLREALGESAALVEDPHETADAYVALIEKRDELEQQLSESEGRLTEATAAFAEAASKTVALRANYDSAFTDQLRAMRADPKRASIIQKILTLHQCDACGAHGAGLASSVQRSLDEQRCPVCASSLAPAEGVDAFEILQQIDLELDAANKVQTTAAKTRLSRQTDHTALLEQYQSVSSQIAAFETSHSSLATLARQKAGAGAGIGAASLVALDASYALTVRKRDEEYKKRDRLQDELTSLNTALKKRYVARRDEFTSLFRALAGDFLGLPVDVQLRQREGASIGLEFALQGSIRSAEHALSESQRFFVDIALRMAVARFISKSGSPAALFIDTPEGSLDIAYETRAGEMFAAFVNFGHSIVMTANINTSRLLLALASLCTSSRMTLVRMTDWAILSEVQERYEKQFSEAFAAIESALNGL